MRNPLRTLWERLRPKRDDTRYTLSEIAWCYMCQHRLFPGHGHIAKNGTQITASTIRWAERHEDLDVPTYLRAEWRRGSGLVSRPVERHTQIVDS